MCDGLQKSTGGERQQHGQGEEEEEELRRASGALFGCGGGAAEDSREGGMESQDSLQPGSVQETHRSTNCASRCCGALIFI